MPAMPPPITTMLRWTSGVVSGIGPRLRDQRHVRLLRERPLAGRRVVPGRREALPVRLVELGEVAAVVVAGPPRLLAEQHVTRVRLGAVVTVPHFPGAKQLVTVAGRHAR